jgi:hypothetical protein
VGRQIRDRSLDALLDLHGQVFVVDPDGKHWVKFVVKRLVGFDSAHPVPPTAGPAGKAGKRHDHKHRLRTIRPYDYKNAAPLLADFWAEVDAMLKERGVIS